VSEPALSTEQFRTFPSDEIEAYKQIMHRITCLRGGSKKIILRILSWIAYSPRDLRGDELQEVIWVEENDEDLNEAQIKKFQIEAVIADCESLVTYDKTTSTIKFSHVTVQEFFDQSDFKDKIGMTHAALAKTCLTYFNFKVFEEPCLDMGSLTERTNKYKFSFYAAKNWEFHFVKAVKDEPENVNLCNAFINTFLESELAAGRRKSMEQISWGPIDEMNILVKGIPSFLAYQASFPGQPLCKAPRSLGS
jgi:hypothetical protein